MIKQERHMWSVLKRQTLFAVVCLLVLIGVTAPIEYNRVTTIASRSITTPQKFPVLVQPQPIQHYPQSQPKKVELPKYIPDTNPLPPASIAPVIARVPTAQPVIFVTIDDGQIKKSESVRFVRRNQLAVTLFLDIVSSKDNFGYFKSLQKVGATIQNHTITHPDLASLTYEQQKSELCGASDTLQQVYGRRPTLFRPPYGDYDLDTQRAASECGMLAVVMWSALMNEGKLVTQAPHTDLQNGDIVLMHFRHDLKQNLETLLLIAQQKGFSIAQLEDYIR